jgi:transcriptional regulator with XRE-family HTH domain
VGIDRSYVGGVERGEHNVALVNLLKIAVALNISLAQLIQKAKL